MFSKSPSAFYKFLCSVSPVFLTGYGKCTAAHRVLANAVPPVHSFNNHDFVFIHSLGFSDYVEPIHILIPTHHRVTAYKDQPLDLTRIIYVYPEETPGDHYVKKITLYLSPGTKHRHGMDVRIILDPSSAIRSFYDDMVEALPDGLSSRLSKDTGERRDICVVKEQTKLRTTDGGARTQMHMRAEHWAECAFAWAWMTLRRIEPSSSWTILIGSIEDAARTISGYLIDKYALNGLPVNKTLLYICTGIPRAPYEMLCPTLLRTQLYQHIFKPFHPNLADNKLEEYVHNGDPQSVVGRWRKDTFNSISGRPAAALDNLIKWRFNRPWGVVLAGEHGAMFDRIAALSKILSQLVGVGIVSLEEHQTIVYSYQTEFGSTYMHVSKLNLSASEFCHPTVITNGSNQPRDELCGYLPDRIQDQACYSHPPSWKAGNENTNNVGPKPFDSIWEKDSRIIIGIDIGSTQSGVAVAFLQKVTQWPGQALEHQSKVPTLALYDKHGKAIAFGAEVEEMMDDTDDRDSGLAKRFKLHMHPSEMREKYSIKLDPLPNGVGLLQIYADFMNYLFKNTEPFFKDRIVDGPTIWEAYKDNITFIIAHPNGWGIREQEFLRRAAVDGGLVTVADSKNRVRFVTEAEASVHYCISHSNISNRLKAGLNFAVCDAGGSTVDITVYTVTSTSPLLKLAEKRDSACEYGSGVCIAGGLYVDDAVEKYLEDTLTRAGIDPEDIKEYVEEGVKDFEKFPKRLFSDGSDSLKLKLGDKGLTNPEISVRRGVMTVPSSSQTDTANRSKAVAEGAIMWNTMTSVFSRAPNWSYGIQGYVRFDSYSSDHRERTTFTTPDGYQKVTGVWCEIVKKGVSLNVDDVCRQSFFRTYSTPKPNLESIEIALYSYAGNDQPKWLRTKNGSLLKGFENVCLITADLRSLSGALEAKIGPHGTYWGLLFWVCVRFGDTEISAYLEWEENVGDNVQKNHNGLNLPFCIGRDSFWANFNYSTRRSLGMRAFLLLVK
ncbi:hypothetical protein AG1IA_03652 [Rhizoctonia solani AG-1 IA]|uniref:Heat shock 70 kDa protein 12A n=1 Tax=Thanatephorus cucumeris (strain AG1-IA) TaxID=983506 RepID=L8WZY2_THACA|nr:hypothetical protein AG1IA_03652 [Rhizoctonia solani AG-1 IA]